MGLAFRVIGAAQVDDGRGDARLDAFSGVCYRPPSYRGPRCSEPDFEERPGHLCGLVEADLPFRPSVSAVSISVDVVPGVEGQ